MGGGRPGGCDASSGVPQGGGEGHHSCRGVKWPLSVAVVVKAAVSVGVGDCCNCL